MEQNAAQFWEAKFSKGDFSTVRPPDLRNPPPDLIRALAHFGGVQDRRVLDLGCGQGTASLFFAANGAHVISIDTSSSAIANLQRYCRAKGIANVDAQVLSAFEIDSLPAIDFVYGRYILHHLEPFAEFAERLGACVAPGGRCYFRENSAQSRVLIWFRTHLVGRLWIPKFGDPEEFPLTPGEIDQLRIRFDVERRFPDFHFFGLAASYLFGGRLRTFLGFIDRQFGRIAWFRRYSYFQELALVRRAERS